MASDGSNLTDFHEAIKAALREQIPALATVRAYTVGHSVDTPAALIELERAELDADDGSGRIPIRCAWTVHCLLSHRTDNVEVEIRRFGAEVLGLVWRNRWGLPAGEPETPEAGPGTLDPQQHGYESWYVTWEQVLYAGPDAWDADGMIPDTVYIGYAPEIGDGHADEYEQVQTEQA